MRCFVKYVTVDDRLFLVKCFSIRGLIQFFLIPKSSEHQISESPVITAVKAT